MTTHLHFAWFNYKKGGRKAPGVYDLKPLGEAMAGLAKPPALVVVNEAKEWGLWGGEWLCNAASVLRSQLNRPYVPLLAHCSRGDIGPALMYDPNVLERRFWGDSDRTVNDDQRNLARFQVWGTPIEFGVIPVHWNYRRGELRMPEADLIAGYGKSGMPMLVLGDFNETASGDHLPQRDWSVVPFPDRRHKGEEILPEVWGPHTRAVDTLVGRWNGKPWGHPEACRVEGAGFQIIAELAAKTGTSPADAFLPTVNDGVDPGGELLIDMGLINKAWLQRGGVVPWTYKVHVPSSNRADWASDHRVVEVTLEIS